MGPGLREVPLNCNSVYVLALPVHNFLASKVLSGWFGGAQDLLPLLARCPSWGPRIRPFCPGGGGLRDSRPLACAQHHCELDVNTSQNPHLLQAEAERWRVPALAKEDGILQFELHIQVLIALYFDRETRMSLARFKDC